MRSKAGFLWDVYVWGRNLHIVLIIARRQLSSGSTMTLLFPLTVGNLLCWFNWIFWLLLTLSIIFSFSQGYQSVLASVTMHWIDFVLIYLITHSFSESEMFSLMWMTYLIEFFKVLCWVLCYNYSLYTSPLGDIARSYGLCYHFFADDTQLFLSFETSSAEDLSICKSTIEECIREIELWMLANKLKLNSNKTEILAFAPSYCPHPALNNLVIVSETVDCSTTAKNTGVIFNNSLSMLTHVTAVCKSPFFHLWNIFKMHKFLSYGTCKILIHAFIMSRIDYCNSLLYGHLKCILQRLQTVLNGAAGLIHLSSRCKHVTPLLIQLHWLPIEQRITFKIAVIRFKALHGSTSLSS